MKLLIYICLYKRTEIAPIVYHHLQEFIKEAENRDIEVETFIVYTLDSDRELFYGYMGDWCDIHALEAENRPLGQKFNAGLQYLEDIDFDYFFQLGCDDIVKPAYIDVILPEMKAKTPIFGCRNLMIYDYSTGKSLKNTYKDVFGAARCIRRDILLKTARRIPVICKYSATNGDRKGAKRYVPDHRYKEKLYFKAGEMVWKLWDDHKEAGLDFNSETKIIEATRETPKTVDGDEYYVIDIKTEDNIHTFDKFEGEVFDVSLEELWHD